MSSASEDATSFVGSWPFTQACFDVPVGQACVPTIRVAIDLLHFEKGAGVHSVMISFPQDTDSSVYNCTAAFCNSPAICDQLRDAGFPAIEAEVAMDGGKLTVGVPCFLGSEVEPVHQMIWRDKDALLTFHGIASADAAPAREKVAASPVAAVVEHFEQEVVAPSVGHPGTELAQKLQRWTATRTNVIPSSRQVYLAARCARFPGLAPLTHSEDVTRRAQKVSQGTLVISGQPDKRCPVITLRPRDGSFVMPAFNFPDVEVLGFRLDLSRYGRDADAFLESLVAPLNFHLSGRDRIATDFRYRAASRVILVELLRYNRMQLMGAKPPLFDNDYQAQHELVVRVLVGRVDDDTAQARDPAIFVPAIFVDNPWSKFLGREVQGFDKQLAAFSSGRRMLLPNGRPHDGASDAPKIPLDEVTSVRLVKTTDRRSGPVLLRLDVQVEDAVEFEEVDLEVALGMTALPGMRWRPEDFGDIDFRRSFATSAFTSQALGFESIQVSPIDHRELPKTWINGRFAIQSVAVARPAGITSLTFKRARAAPDAWNDLCRLIGPDQPQEFVTGEWYRLKTSMSLTIDESLSW